ncbi:uncharacterized protein LTR77_000304 [Saxophila tyrrhenica]|uniref:Uncharacterized protein n=1 Tax=Saxophila tyrrhenica TaxID=1690608 RepID=A0AAV9PQS2_9PEZI|nr:hypothetical protein LTR77_000304 [Saxophila tyrrhenica]
MNEPHANGVIEGSSTGLDDHGEKAITVIAAVTTDTDRLRINLQRKAGNSFGTKEETNSQSKVAQRTIKEKRVSISATRRRTNQYIKDRMRAIRKGRVTKEGLQPKKLLTKPFKDPLLQSTVSMAKRILPNEPPTAEQLASLLEAEQPTQNYFARTASLIPGDRFGFDKRPSSGHTTSRILLPDAETRKDYVVHNSIRDLTQAQQVHMVGHHLMWTNLKGDEYLSYSKSPVFTIVHGLNRMDCNQGNVTIQYIDRRRATRADETIPAAFYHALDLYRIFQIHHNPGWTVYHRKKLRPRMFTQELLSHGVVRVQDSRFKPARIKDLIRDGLLDVFPELYMPSGGHRRTPLYEGQVAFRRQCFPAKHKDCSGDDEQLLYSYGNCARGFIFTVDELIKVQTLVRNFMKAPSGYVPGVDQAIESHLHIFLDFLAAKKRPKEHPIFLAWIKEHYSAANVLDLYSGDDGNILPKFTHVASNLPQRMQYLDLVRDAGAVFGLPALPATVVETQDRAVGEIYVNHDAGLQRYVETYKEWDEEKYLQSNKGRKDRKMAREAALQRMMEAGADDGDPSSAGSDDEDGEVDGKDASDGREGASGPVEVDAGEEERKMVDQDNTREHLADGEDQAGGQGASEGSRLLRETGEDEAGLALEQLHNDIA